MDSRIPQDRATKGSETESNLRKFLPQTGGRKSCEGGVSSLLPAQQMSHSMTEWRLMYAARHRGGSRGIGYGSESLAERLAERGSSERLAIPPPPPKCRMDGLVYHKGIRFYRLRWGFANGAQLLPPNCMHGFTVLRGCLQAHRTHWGWPSAIIAV